MRGGEYAIILNWLDSAAGKYFKDAFTEHDPIAAAAAEAAAAAGAAAAAAATAAKKYMDKVKDILITNRNIISNIIIDLENTGFEPKIFKDFSKIETLDKTNTVSDFLLSFFYKIDYNKQPPFKCHFTYDSSGKYVSKLVRKMPEVFTLITQANQADSAITSHGQPRTEYEFRSEKVGGDRNIRFGKIIDDNKVIHGKIQFRQIPDYNKDNPFNFETVVILYEETVDAMDVNGATTEEDEILAVSITYDAVHSKGPSVDYLMGLILLINKHWNSLEDGFDKMVKDPDYADLKRKTVVNHMADLENLLKVIYYKLKERNYETNDIIHITYGILYDLKNCGDYGQIETLYSKKHVILVSVDELCVFWSKLCSVLYNEPQYQSIWHVNERLRCSRTEQEEILPIDKLKIKLDYMKSDVNKLTSETKILKNFDQQKMVEFVVKMIFGYFKIMISKPLYIGGTVRTKQYLKKNDEILSFLVMFYIYFLLKKYYSIYKFLKEGNAEGDRGDETDAIEASIDDINKEIRNINKKIDDVESTIEDVEKSIVQAQSKIKKADEKIKEQLLIGRRPYMSTDYNLVLLAIKVN